MDDADAGGASTRKKPILIFVGGGGCGSNNNGVDGGGSLTGSYATYGWNGRSPYHAINFVTVHDGFTMSDLFPYDEKQNDSVVSRGRLFFLDWVQM